jgi:ribose-phosphate pyrophosphokinase
MELRGDVQDKICIIVDDMTDTSGTITKAASELKKSGAKEVYAFVTHGIFSGPAAERIKNSDITKIVCTDSMKIDQATFDAMGGKLVYVSLDLFLAELIRRSINNESAEELFEIPVYK